MDNPDIQVSDSAKQSFKRVKLFAFVLNVAVLIWMFSLGTLCGCVFLVVTFMGYVWRMSQNGTGFRNYFDWFPWA